MGKDEWELAACFAFLEMERTGAEEDLVDSTDHCHLGLFLLLHRPSVAVGSSSAAAAVSLSPSPSRLLPLEEGKEPQKKARQSRFCAPEAESGDRVRTMDNARPAIVASRARLGRSVRVEARPRPSLRWWDFSLFRLERGPGSGTSER